MFAVPRTADFLVLSGFVAMLLLYIVDNKSSFKFCSVFAALGCRLLCRHLSTVITQHFVLEI